MTKTSTLRRHSGQELDFHALADNIPDLIIRLDRRLTFLYINPAITRITGIPTRFFIGKPFFSIGIPKEIIEEWRTLLLEVFRSGKEALNMISLETPNGMRHFHTRVVPEFTTDRTVDTLLAIAHDITERTLAEERLAQAAQEWKTTFDSIPDFIYILDREMKLRRINKTCANIFQRSPESLIGKYCFEVFRKAKIPCPGCLNDQVLQTGKPADGELTGSPCATHLSVSVTPLFNTKGEIVNTIHVAKDITELKKAQQVLQRDKDMLEILIREKTEALLRAQQELENNRRLSDIGVLAATIAHEIRNPLAAIGAAAFNVKRKCPGQLIAGHLATIDKKVMESDQIIKNLLNYSRIKLPNYERVNLCDLLKDACDTAMRKYSRWSVSIVRDFPPADPTVMEADPIHLRVLFSNILDNAYQSFEHKQGRITVTASCSPLNNDTATWTIVFTDNGSGIDAEDLARIQEPFFTRKSRGVGLGLSVCTQIVNRHNGTISFESSKNMGTAVTITLPTKNK